MNSDEDLKEKMKVLLSNSDFGKYIPNLDKKVVRFADLEHYNDIYDLMPEWEDYRIILIESKPRSGHWVCITRRHNHFIFLIYLDKRRQTLVDCLRL